MWNKIGYWLFPQLYWKGRLDGWRACEDMAIARIERYYPKSAEEMSENIFQ